MKHKNLVIEALVNTFGGYLVFPLMLVSSLIVRQKLGPYLAGVSATLALISTYATYTSLGVINAAERELPYCNGSGDQSRFDRIRYSTFVLVMGPALVFSLGVVIWSLLHRPTLDNSLYFGLLVYSVVLLGQQWGIYYTILLRTAKEFVFLGKVQILVSILSAIGNVVGVVLFGWMGFLLTTTIIAILGAIFLTKRTAYLPPLRLDWPETRQLFIIGAPLFVHQLILTVMRTVDNVLVLHLLGTESLGYYTIALISNTIIFMTTANLGALLFPRMQEAYGLHRTVESLSQYVVRPTIVMGLLLLVMISIFYFVIPVVVHSFLPRFAPGLLAFKIITLGTYFFASFQMSGAFLISLNKQLKLAVLLACAIALTVGLAVVFFRLGWGLEGIALATVLGYMVCFVSTNAYALSHWAQGRQIAGFLWDLTLPFIYSTALLVLLDQYQVYSVGGETLAFVLAFTKLLIFLLAYSPLIVFMEPKTRLIAEFARPIVLRLMRRTAES